MMRQEGEGFQLFGFRAGFRNNHLAGTFAPAAARAILAMPAAQTLRTLPGLNDRHCEKISLELGTGVYHPATQQQLKSWPFPLTEQAAI